MVDEFVHFIYSFGFAHERNNHTAHSLNTLGIVKQLLEIAVTVLLVSDYERPAFATTTLLPAPVNFEATLQC